MFEIELKQFEMAYDILESSFIPAELKPRELLRSQFNRGEVDILGIEESGELAGVITLWVFSDFVFAENFAVNKKFRNKGMGSQLLLNVIDKYQDKRIILEVEPAENEIQKRRIGFYERNGFTLSPFHYIQPPLRAGYEDVKLQIMYTGDTLKPSDFYSIKKDIFKTVYKTEKIL